MPSPANYAELQVTTNFSFLEGASHPHELVVRAAELGLSAIAITDRNSLAGIVRAHLAARELDVKLIVGCRLTFMDGSPDLLCYPKDRAAYGRLCRLLTVGKSDRVFKQKGANGASASWPPLSRPSRDKIQKLEFLKLDGRVEPG
ncbi:MAG: PHP domain-containing protein, partial [Rhodomicrobium sp.]